jgi:hypothetical protein
MQRTLLALAAAAALAGCAQWNERVYGSWLDTYGVPPPGVRQAVPEPQASELRTQIAALETQAEALRVKLAGEPDRVKRFALMRELRDIGDRETELDVQLHLGPQAPLLRRIVSPPKRGA